MAIHLGVLFGHVCRVEVLGSDYDCFFFQGCINMMT